MRNVGLEEESGIKISWRNINNLRFAYDGTLMAENEEDLSDLLMTVKNESAKAGLLLDVIKANWLYHSGDARRTYESILDEMNPN